MIGSLLAVCAALATLDTVAKSDDTKVSRGRDIFGNRYKKVSGECFRCDGTGKVNGHTCRKCGGSGTYSRCTWYE